MRNILEHRSKRHGYDAWCVRVVGTDKPLPHTACTTRAEARDLKRERETHGPDLFRKIEIVKVRIVLETVE